VQKAARIVPIVGSAIGVLGAIIFLFAGYTAKNGVVITNVIATDAGKYGPITLVATGQGSYGTEIALAGWITLALTFVVTVGWLLSGLRGRFGLAGTILIVGAGLTIFLLPSPVTLLAALLWLAGGIIRIVVSRRMVPAEAES